VDAFYRVPRPDWERIFSHFKRQMDVEHEQVVDLGGLHILGTERHEARRIDNQLRGRAGRQGDPGSSRFYLSLEDDLMRIFGSDRISGLMQKLGMEEGVPIEHGMVTRAIERAQKQVEAQNFGVRKHLLEYDDVMNKQRESVYTLRREILEGNIHLTEEEIVNTREYALALAEEILEDIVDRYAGKQLDVDEWDIPAAIREVSRVFGLDQKELESLDLDSKNTDEITDAIWAVAKGGYERKEQSIGVELLRRLERDIMLQIVDAQWKDHLYSLDHLKEGIGLRGYGQRDPLVEYKKESFGLFQDMKARIEEEIVRYLFWLRPVSMDEGGEVAAVSRAPRPAPRRPAAAALTMNNPGAAPVPAFAARSSSVQAQAPVPARTGGDDVVKTVRREEPKVGRNDPCPCGSGKKYKKCHGQAA
jgi:preprotein translocase subunit SecA